MRWLLDNTCIKPEVIVNGGSLMLLKIKSLNIRFIDTCSFVAAPLASLPKMFGLENHIRKGTFPHTFNRPENYGYVGEIPDISFYDPEQKSEVNRADLLRWHAEQRQLDKVFNFYDEILSYCENDTLVLRLCGEAFRKSFVETTSIDPFQSITIASACNKVYRTHFLLPDTIAILPPNGYKGNDIQSYLGIMWLEYMRQSTGHDIQHAKNGGEKELILKSGQKIKLDGYYEEGQIKWAYEFFGDFYHGCETCFQPNTFNPLLRETMQSLNRKTKARIAALQSEGYRVVSIWECQWKLQMKTDPNVIEFLRTYRDCAPLNPRDAFSGGRTNASVLHYKTQGTERIRYMDINSLYPFVNKTCTYPVGHAIINRGPDVDLNKMDQYFGMFTGFNLI